MLARGVVASTWWDRFPPLLRSIVLTEQSRGGMPGIWYRIEGPQLTRLSAQDLKRLRFAIDRMNPPGSIFKDVRTPGDDGCWIQLVRPADLDPGPDFLLAAGVDEERREIRRKMRESA